MVTSEKNTLKGNYKRPLWITFAAVLMLAATTLSMTSCHNQPKPEDTKQDSTITDEQKLADLEAEKAVAEKEFAAALQAAEQAQADADQKAKIAKKKGTKEAKAEADEAQKKADELKADADAKGKRVKQLDMEISQLKMKLAGDEGSIDEDDAAADQKATVDKNKKKNNITEENDKLKGEKLSKDFHTILNNWKNGKNSMQKANQFCTGTIGIRIKNNDPYTTLEQHFNGLDNDKKAEMIDHMRNFKYTGDKE